MGVAQEVLWWDSKMSVHCKLMNRRNSDAKILTGYPVPYMITLTTLDTERLDSLFYLSLYQRPKCIIPKKTLLALELEPHKRVWSGRRQLRAAGREVRRTLRR